MIDCGKRPRRLKVRKREISNMSVLNTSVPPDPNIGEKPESIKPSPEVVFPKTVSAEELKRLQELDLRHKCGDFRRDRL